MLVPNLEVARSRFGRMRGLLGRRELPEGRGLLIENCSSIHTWFMKFAIDVIFVDASGTVRKLARDVRPWRMAGCFGARDVVELAGGALAGLAVAVGDEVRVEAT